jgi:hypothetical protein
MDYQTFIAVYDEFSDVAQAKVQYHLNRAFNHIDFSIYGIHQEEAMGLLTAHFLALSSTKKTTNTSVETLGFKPGDVKRIEIQDDILVEFNTTPLPVGSAIESSSNSDLGSTVYGQQLEALKHKLIIPFTYA